MSDSIFIPDPCNDLLPDAELLLDSMGALLLVAPLPASRLFSRLGLRAQMYACSEDTVKTPSRFKVLFVGLDI